MANNGKRWRRDPVTTAFSCGIGHALASWLTHGGSDAANQTRQVAYPKRRSGAFCMRSAPMLSSDTWLFNPWRTTTTARASPCAR